MELKHAEGKEIENENARSNRTFMELKPLRDWDCTSNHQRSNRTFMELKLTTTGNIDITQRVLIVPLWN